VAKMPSPSDLRIPEIKHEKSWFDTRPRQVAEWVESLPLGDTDETTKQLFSVLSHINRVKIAAPARLKALDGLYPTFCFCINALKKNYLGQSFPLNERALKYVDRTLAMYSELVTSYKIAIADLLERNRFYEKKALTTAFYMSLDSLGQLQLSHYQIYAPEPSQLWLDIHTLYSIAEQKNLHQLDVKETPIESLGNTSIEKKYKQILLLSLSNPYHLGKNEIVMVQKMAQDYSDSCRIINPDTETKGEAHFVSCLNQDKPAMEFNLIKSLDDCICRFIDTSELTQQLRLLLTQTQDTFNVKDSTSQRNRIKESALYRQLINAWDTREKRSFSRSTSQGGLDISIGLNSTHYLIEESTQPFEEEIVEDTPQEEESSFIDDTKNPLDIHHTTFSIEPVAGEADGESVWEGNSTHIHLTQLNDTSGHNIPKPTYNYYPWKTLNAGAGGYCLLWDHNRSSNAQIGEIVGLRESSNGSEHNWRIGVVRWMQYMRNQGLKLGIQILSPNALTMQSKLMKGRASQKQEYSCLSLPEIKAIKQPATLLTPSLHYKVGDALILNDHGKMMNVQLTRLIENTGNYSRFQYAHVNSSEEQQFEQDLDSQANEWETKDP